MKDKKEERQEAPFFGMPNGMCPETYTQKFKYPEKK